jgi:hypothetical protein
MERCLVGGFAGITAAVLFLGMPDQLPGRSEFRVAERAFKLGRMKEHVPASMHNPWMEHHTKLVIRFGLAIGFSKHPKRVPHGFTSEYILGWNTIPSS